MDYVEADPDQVATLVGRSAYCYQEFTYDCIKSALHRTGLTKSNLS